MWPQCVCSAESNATRCFAPVRSMREHAYLNTKFILYYSDRTQNKYIKYYAVWYLVMKQPQWKPQPASVDCQRSLGQKEESEEALKYIVRWEHNINIRSLYEQWDRYSMAACLFTWWEWMRLLEGFLCSAANEERTTVTMCVIMRVYDPSYFFMQSHVPSIQYINNDN